MDKVVFFKRSFLNTDGHHSNAAIVCDIKDCREDDYGDPFWGHYKLSDCENNISLAVDLGSVGELDNTLFKLDTLISITQQFRDHAASLRKDVEEYEEKKRIEKEESEAKKKAKEKEKS